jgi:hypothetical protein
MEERTFASSSPQARLCRQSLIAAGLIADSARCSRNGGWGDKPQWQGFSTVDGIRGTVFDIDLPDKSGIILGKYYPDITS